MTTARNLLYTDLIKVLGAKSNETVRERILSTLDKYRVQMKPGMPISSGTTARESLFNDIIETCTVIPSAEVPRRLQALFDRYRMQAKKKGELEKEAKSKDTIAVGASGNKKNGVGVKKKSLVKMEPLGGGPVKRTKARGECPKCHSMGVVLAHSYAGDDYFSCIYCGFQAYRAVVETDLDLPLAAELLGRRFDEKSEVEPDELETEIP